LPFKVSKFLSSLLGSGDEYGFGFGGELSYGREGLEV